MKESDSFPLTLNIKHLGHGAVIDHKIVLHQYDTLYDTNRNITKNMLKNNFYPNRHWSLHLVTSVPINNI